MDNRKKEPKEDVPEYRSVMLARPMVPPPMSFASMGPPAFKTRQSVPVKQAPSGAAPRWEVPNLPTLPAHYPLGRTNVYLKGSGQEVADRICNFLKTESVSAAFSAEDKTILRAETSKCLKFAVRLFEDQGMTVVEVQRMAGCGYEFSQVARGVCRSAKGVTSAPKRKLPMPSCIPRQSPEEKIRRIDSGIRMAMDMLLSARTDLQLLGLQSLEQIAIGLDSASSQAENILSGDCLEKLISFVVSTNAALLSESEERNFNMMQRKSLVVLSHCLQNVSSTGKLTKVLREAKCLDTNTFIKSLVGFLNESLTWPHEAMYSAQCLQYISGAEGVRQILADMDVSSAISKACAAGAHSNLLLEAESNKLKANLLL
mmetsp:Transcript_60483/g.91213  ORF Transcript_60483/g.91213 Transcript_60483/m.91213 type:complete len:372 (-) Transcript_60483:45-1160(-)